MTLSRADQQRARQWAESLPGQRGRDVPPDVYDTIYHVGNGITMSVWGRPILPQQIAWLHEQGATTPQAIHQALGAQPHPHAPTVSVADYGHYATALKTYREHKS